MSAPSRARARARPRPRPAGARPLGYPGSQPGRPSRSCVRSRAHRAKDQCFLRVFPDAVRCGTCPGWRPVYADEGAAREKELVSCRETGPTASAGGPACPGQARDIWADVVYPVEQAEPSARGVGRNDDQRWIGARCSRHALGSPRRATAVASGKRPPARDHDRGRAGGSGKSPAQARRPGGRDHAGDRRSRHGTYRPGKPDSFHRTPGCLGPSAEPALSAGCPGSRGLMASLADADRRATCADRGYRCPRCPPAGWSPRRPRLPNRGGRPA